MDEQTGRSTHCWNVVMPGITTACTMIHTKRQLLRYIYTLKIYIHIYIYIYINTIRQCGGGPALNNTGAFSIRRRQPGETTALKRHWLVYNICKYNGIYMWYIYIYIYKLYCDISIYESPPCLRVAMIRRSLRVVAAWW